MPTTKIDRAARKFASAWGPRNGEFPDSKQIVRDFFRQMESYPSQSLHTNESARSSYDFQVVKKVASEAEKQLGYKPEKTGWLTWLGGILREETKLLRQLRHSASSWPPLERQIFESYYVDGMTLMDIARISGCTAKTFNAHLAFIQFRVRREMIREVLHESKFVKI